MVKPVYPHKRQTTVHDDPNGGGDESEAEGAVGYSSSFSQMRHLLSHDDNDVFRPGLGAPGPEPTQSIRHSARNFKEAQQSQSSPIPAPRERVSSVPDEDLSLSPSSSAERGRTRRSSAPVPPVPRERVSSAPDVDVSPPPAPIPPALRDIATKGQELFWFILSEEVKAREVQDPGSFSALTIPSSSHRMEILNERGQCGGRTLRQIAEAFAHSTQRLRVRQHAEQIDYQTLNYDSFSDLLYGLFQDGGVTQGRVLVLFYFCSDVALRALKERLTHQFQQLVDWTSRYITERLSTWIFDHGGWSAVLQESIDQALKYTVLGLCCVSIIVCAAVILHRF